MIHATLIARIAVGIQVVEEGCKGRQVFSLQSRVNQQLVHLEPCIPKGLASFQRLVLQHQRQTPSTGYSEPACLFS